MSEEHAARLLRLLALRERLEAIERARRLAGTDEARSDAERVDRYWPLIADELAHWETTR